MFIIVNNSIYNISEMREISFVKSDAEYSVMTIRYENALFTEMIKTEKIPVFKNLVSQYIPCVDISEYFLENKNVWYIHI